MSTDEVLVPVKVIGQNGQFLVNVYSGQEVLNVYDFASGSNIFWPVAFEASRDDQNSLQTLVRLKHVPCGQVLARIGKPTPKSAEPKPVFESSPPAAADVVNAPAILLTTIKHDRLCYEAPGPVVRVFDNGVAVQHFGQIGSRYFELHHEPKGIITVDYKLPLTAPEGEPVVLGVDPASGHDKPAPIPAVKLPQLGDVVEVAVSKLVDIGNRQIVTFLAKVYRVKHLSRTIDAVRLPELEFVERDEYEGLTYNEAQANMTWRWPAAESAEAPSGKLASGGLHQGGMRIVGERYDPHIDLREAMKLPPLFFGQVKDAPEARLNTGKLVFEVNIAPPTHRDCPALNSLMKVKLPPSPNTAHKVHRSPDLGDIVLIYTSASFLGEPCERMGSAEVTGLYPGDGEIGVRWRPIYKIDVSGACRLTYDPTRTKLGSWCWPEDVE